MFASELNYFAVVLSLCCSTGVRVGAFGSESTLYMVYFYTVMETLEDERMESIVEDYWRKFEWFVDEDRIDYLVNFTVKVIDYRFRFLQPATERGGSVTTAMQTDTNDCQIICVICEGVKKFRRIRQLPDVRA